MTAKPLVSVMVPAHNEEKVIGGTLSSLLDQTAPQGSYEIVVVDDGSTDRTAQMVLKAAKKNPKAGIRLVSKSPAGGKSSAINRGVREVRGRYVLITDADIVVSRDWIEVMVKGLKRYDMVQGAWFGYRPKTFTQKIEHAQFLAEYRYGGLYITLTRNGANNGFRREVFKKAGPFDERSTVCTQGFYQRGLEAGYTLTYLPHSVVYTRGLSRFPAFVEQRLRWREYDGPASLMRNGLKGLAYTLGLSLLTFLTLFILPFLWMFFPLFMQDYLPWWTLWHLIAFLVLLVMVADLAKHAAPLARMLGRDARPEDRGYAKYLVALVPVLFFLRILTVPWYIYRLVKPRRTGAFTPARD